MHHRILFFGGLVPPYESIPKEIPRVVFLLYRIPHGILHTAVGIVLELTGESVESHSFSEYSEQNGGTGERLLPPQSLDKGNWKATTQMISVITNAISAILNTLFTLPLKRNTHRCLRLRIQ